MTLFDIKMPERVAPGMLGVVIAEDGGQIPVRYEEDNLPYSLNGKLVDPATGEVLAYGDAMLYLRGGEKLGYYWADLMAYTRIPIKVPIRKAMCGIQGADGVERDHLKAQIIVQFPL